ncbi:hypothetical protein F5Y03DRAFT_407289 [Xylaria venustula]|nr:hypothetical protein F5Y03DRAFT_407289 [Xylaria venustula]
MSDIDLDVSNGSCWSNVNVALEDDYIPCGNAADGNSYACCHYGDNCLSSNACYHAKFGITYLAGCTSQDFSGPACQNKGIYVNQSWVGLTRCDPDQSSWAGCPEEEGVVGSEPPTANCKCSKDAVLFQDSPTLDNIASLPLTLGGFISWFPGHDPTRSVTTKTPSSTLTHSTPSTILSLTSSDSPAESNPTVSSQPTPTSSTTTPPTSGLSSGAKAGIGIGSVFGIIAVGWLVITLILRKRKAKKKEPPKLQPFLPTTEPDSARAEPSVPNFTELGVFKAELPADGPLSASTMASSSIPYSPSPAQTPAPSTTPHQYQPYRPGAYGNHRNSDASQLSSRTQGYPESLPSTLSPQLTGESRITPAGRGHPKNWQPDVIHEMQG